MVHLGGVCHGSPDPVKVKEPHVVVTCDPIVVDIEITDVGTEVVGGNVDVFI